MKLELELSLAQTAIPLGAEIPVRLTLRNAGDTPADLVSLADNNVVTNYVLYDAEGKLLGTFNHVSRQVLFEKTEPRTSDEVPITLAPQADETRDYNFALLHWIDEPGEYALQGLYSWGGTEVRSEPVRFEVYAAPPLFLDAQWSYHYGEKFLLHSAWVARTRSGHFELFLRESARFRPQVINYNPSVHEADQPFEPRLSFATTQLAGGPVWVAWTSGETEIECLLTEQGVKRSGPFRIDVGAEHRWLAAPMMRADGSLLLLLEVGAQADAQPLGFIVSPDGSAGERLGFEGQAGDRLRLAVPNDQGSLTLVWTSSGGEVRAQDFDLGDLRSGGPGQTIWRCPDELLDVCAAPVLNEERHLAVVHRSAPESPAIEMTWLSAAARPGEDPLLKSEILELPEGGGPLRRCSGQMDARAHLFLLAETDAALHYVNGALMHERRLADAAELTESRCERLVVSPRGDVFLSRGRDDLGLHESLLHRGSDEDLDEDEE